MLSVNPRSRISAKSALLLLNNTSVSCEAARPKSLDIMTRRKETAPVALKSFIANMKFGKKARERQSMDSQRVTTIREMNFSGMTSIIPHLPPVSHKQRFGTITPLQDVSAKHANFFMRAEKGRTSFSKTGGLFNKKFKLNAQSLACK